jgi:glycerate kinase
MIQLLEKGLRNYASIIKRDLGKDIAHMPGSGAAGGLAAGLAVFCSATLESGVLIVAQFAGLEETLRNANLVITSEGRIDFQTAYGKLPVGVAKLAGRYRVPVVAMAASLGKGVNAVYDCGIDAVMSIMDSPMTREVAMKKAARLLEEASERMMRLLLIRRDGKSRSGRE